MTVPPPQPGLSADERAQCQVMAAMLQAMRVPAAWGLMAAGLAMLAVLALAVFSPSPIPHGSAWAVHALLAAVLLSPVERYFAFRLQLDTHLFTQLACGAFTDLPALDSALSQLGLRASTTGTPTRPLADRLVGTLRLMRRHSLVLALQGLAWLAALLIAALGWAN